MNHRALTFVLGLLASAAVNSEKIGVWVREDDATSESISLRFDVRDKSLQEELAMDEGLILSNSPELVKFYERTKELETMSDDAFANALGELSTAVEKSNDSEGEWDQPDTIVDDARDLGGVHASMDTLNSILRKLHMQIPVNVANIKTSISIVTIEAKMGHTASCSGLSLGGIDLSGNMASNTEYDWNARVQGIRVACRVCLCVRSNVPFFKDWMCGGTITLHSGGSRLNMIQRAKSPDFRTQLPTQMSNGNGCPVSLLGITFTGQNILKILNYDTTSIIIKMLNGPMKQTAMAPLVSAACSMAGKVRKQVNAMAIDNQLTTALNVNPPKPDPLSYERQLPSNIPFLNLQNNSFSQYLPISTDPSTEEEALTVDTRSPYILGVLQSIGVPVSDTVSLIPALVQLLTGAPYVPKQRIDLLKAAEHFLPNISQYLHADLSVPGLGSFAVNATGLGLTMDGTFPFTYYFDILGKETIAVPPIEFSDIKLDATASISMNIDTKLEGNAVKFKLSQTFTTTLEIKQFISELATLLAVRTDKVDSFFLGPMLESPFDCLFSNLFDSPMVTELILKAAAISLRMDGFSDGIGVVLGEALATFFPMYAGKLPDAISYYAAKAIVGKKLFNATTCPEPALSKDASKLYDFSVGPVAALGNMDTSALVNILLPTGAAVLVSGPRDLFSLPIKDIPGVSDQTLTLWLDELAVGLGKTDKIEVLHVPQNRPHQLLENQVVAENLEISITARLDSSAGGSFSSRPTAFPTLQPTSPTNQPTWAPTDAYASSSAPTSSTPSVSRHRALSSNDPVDRLIGKSNKVKITFGAGSLALGLDLLATITNNDFVTTPVTDVLSLPCWLGKLQPYGGPANFSSGMHNVTLSIDCSECDSILLQALARTFSDPNAQSDMFQAIGGLENDAVKLVKLEFTEERWNNTIAAAQAKCKQSHSGLTASPTADLGGLPEDQTYAIVALAILLFILAVGSVVMLVPAFRRRKLHQMEHTEGSKQNIVTPLTSDVGAEAVEYAFQAPLWRNPSIPLCVRVLIPLFFVLNLAGLLLGHLLLIVTVNATAYVLPGSANATVIELPDLDSFNVVSIVQKMWRNNAVLLAFVVALFSLVWPYVKLLMMVVCWFLPTTLLPFRWRGLAMHMIERVGRWSLIEVFVVSFCMIALNIDVHSPNLSWLPKDLYLIQVHVAPQFNLYIFTIALFLGLAVSNVINAYHNRIGEARILHRCDELGGSVAHQAKEKLALVPTVFVGKRVWLGCLLIIGLALALSLVMLAGELKSVQFEVKGLLGKVMEAGGDATFQELSLFNLLGNAARDGGPGLVFFTSCIILVAIVFPVLQLILMAALSLPFTKLTLGQAMKWREANTILGAWCSLEVYVVGLALSSMELGYLTTMLLQDQCAEITLIFSTVLYPAGILSKEDAQAGCLTLVPGLQSGAFWFLAAVSLTLVMQLFFKFSLDKFIALRSPCLPSDQAPPKDNDLEHPHHQT